MHLIRNRFLRRGAAAGLALMLSVMLAGASTAAAQAPDAPHLPPGFGKTFTSRFVDTGGLRQHIVIGGDGPPLLLVHGWPENWYQYRAVMPALARDFTVIAVDQRGMGLTDKPAGGYDSATLANDLVAVMDALGYRHFSVLGLDTGMVISYALAADHPDRVARLVVGEAPLPGVTDPRTVSLFLPGPFVPRLFHLAFNRLDTLNGSSSAAAKTCSSASSSTPKPPPSCPTTPSGTTPPASRRAAPRSAAASGSTARGTRPPRRTRSAARRS